MRNCWNCGADLMATEEDREEEEALGKPPEKPSAAEISRRMSFWF